MLSIDSPSKLEQVYIDVVLRGAQMSD